MTTAAHAGRSERETLAEVHAAIHKMTGRAEAVKAGHHERPSFARIVVCHDGTPASSAALQWASHLARLHQAHVTVASVAPPDLFTSAPWAMAYAVPILEDHRKVVAEFRDIADAAADQLRSESIEAESVSTEGDPARELAHIARTQRADLVILGARGRGEVRRVLLGSTADSILGRVDASVLVARTPPRGRRVLVAVDGSSSSHRAVAAALRYASHEGASVTVQHVLDTYRDVQQNPTYGFLRDVIGRMDLPTPPRVTYVIDAGRPAREIVRRAESEDASLVVVGARGLGRITGALLGSVSHRVANSAHTNVLVIREKE